MNKRVVSFGALAVILAMVVLSAPASASSEPHEATISATLALPSKRIVTGSVVHATLRIVNRTGSDVTVTTCGSPFQVALVSKTYAPEIGWFGCAMRFTIPLGKSTYDVPLRASYESCGGEGTIPGQGAPLPCVGGAPPPLPVGKYQVKVYENPEVVSAPALINVRVVGPQR
jgi:hypothetical protein